MPSPSSPPSPTPPPSCDLELVAIGCGRSGTGWAARHLTAHGVPCGHESVFDWNPLSSPHRRLDYPGRTPSPHEAPGPLRADASLAAIAYLDQLEAHVRVWHIARDPAACIASWTHSAILEDDRTPYGLFCRTHVPAIALESHPLGRAARWVAEWNLRGYDLARWRVGYRLERLEDIAADSRPVNGHPHPDVPLSAILERSTAATVQLLTQWQDLAGY